MDEVLKAMRGTIVGIIIGSVIGVMVGTTIIAPRLVNQPNNENNPTEFSKDKKEIPKSTNSKIQSEINDTQNSLNPSISWRMASAYSDSLPQLGKLARRTSQNIWKISNGKIEIKYFAPDSLVPTSELFDAVASGAIDAGFSSPGAWAHKEPALQLFSSIPFGPSASEYLAWIYFGGGINLLNDIYRPHGIKSIICGMISPEAGGWFRRSLITPTDLSGLRMQATGLGAKVLQKIGVKTYKFKDADILLAFENGDIDGVEFSMPSIDLKLGFYQLANHYYFPGWQQPSSFFELIVNKEQWDTLSDIMKAQIRTVCGDNVRFSLAEGEALQYDALKELTAKGVNINRWPTAVLTKLENAWKEVANEEASSNTNFNTVWSSLSRFRKEYAIWKELANP